MTASYSVKFMGVAGTETVVAEGFNEDGLWTDFTDIHGGTSLRVRSSDIERITKDPETDTE